MSRIDEKINFARKELLDLSLKNSLLNYRLRVASGLEFPQLNASDVFSYLVNENKKVFFTTEKSNNPSKLYVDMTEKDMHGKILRTFRSSKMYLEERGANILFLALGFLKWKEREGDAFYRAPLILVPVELKKVNVQEKYYLQYSGEEIRLNISLITKMQNDFNIDLNYEYEDEIRGIDEYLRKVNDAVSVSSNEGWVVETTSGAFDFFSYAKFLMYKDLDLSAWRENGEKQIKNPMLEKLFITDFSDNDNPVIDAESELSPYKIFNVVDVDSSQARVVYDINCGKNMVIQGPPGTGKSQTITNIIAASIARGKSVLFVAEKKAALDVVKSKLDKIGLEDLVLELHSQKTNKVDILKSIETTVNLGAPKVQEDDMLKTKYEDSKREIDAYRKILNNQVAKSQISLVEVYGNALKLKEKNDRDNTRLPRVHICDDLTEWSEDEFEKKLGIVREYQELLNSVGKIEKHPFYGIEMKECLPYEQVTIKEKVFDLDDALTSFISVVDEIGSIFGNRNINNIFESGRLVNSIDAADKYRDISALNCQDSFLLSHIEEVDEYISVGREIQKFRGLLPDYRNESYLEYEDYIKLFDEYSDRNIDRERREELKVQLAVYMADGKFSKAKLTDYYQFVVHVAKLLRNESTLRFIFKDMYKGLFDTNWNRIRDMLKPAREFISLINSYNVIPQTKSVVSDNDAISKLLDLREEYFERKKYLEDCMSQFVETTKFNSVLKYGYNQWYLDMQFNDLKRAIAQWKNNVDSIIEVARYNELTDKMNKVGLQPLLDCYYQTGKYDHLDDILSYEYYDALINYAYAHNDYLQQFKEFKFERIIDSFREMDTRLMVENIKYILKHHYENMPRINDESREMGILRRELQKKKNQMPVRKLFSNIGGIIQKIKPVFMMSPISVASFLPPKSISFDLVVFDEASQVRPVEAFGSILRARQLVVVGDSKQLPPTTFFDTLTTKYDDMNDEDYDIVNMESILSLLLSKNIPERTLSWHYRSKNQSLINVSNNEFYNQTLKVFPSVYDKDPNHGLVYVPVPNSVYARGTTRSNKIEAKAVIKAVFEHIQQHPEMSIGVVSFSLSQQQELYREFDLQLKKHTDEIFAKYFDSSSPEPFFIKNLESVQGDERDVIFISIGYGFDENGKLSMDFGPLNKDGGERRLNVLITRAKYKCFVFSNISSHDINLSKTSSRGVIALKSFLEYAQNRVIFLSKNQVVSDDSFIDYISQQLIDYGYDVDRSIGSRVGLDIAVYDKEVQRFIAGIECDGGAYKDIEVATDRERIRKNVLRTLGWKIYHVWAPDFYRNPKNEFNKVLDFLQDVKKNEAEEVQKSKKLQIERRHSEKLKQEKLFVPYKEYTGPKRRSLVLDDEGLLKELILKVVSTESPINTNALKRQLMIITNENKLTDEQIASVQKIVSENPAFAFRNDFVYMADQTVFEVRNRESLNKFFKKAEFVAPEEYVSFVLMLLNSGEAANRDEIFKNIPDYLGIPKSKYAVDVLNGIVDRMIEEKRIYIENEMIYFNDDYSKEDKNE